MQNRLLCYSFPAPGYLFIWFPSVAPGCAEIQITNGPLKITKIHPFSGAVLSFNCDPGFVLEGPPTIYCNKRQWNDIPPECIANPITLDKLPESGLHFSVTYLQPTEEATTHVKPVKTTTSSFPFVVENYTTAHDEIPSNEKVKEYKTTASALSHEMSSSSPPTSTWLALFSTANWELSASTIQTQEHSQTATYGELATQSTSTAEESTKPSSVQSNFSSTDDVMVSASTHSSAFARMTQFPIAHQSISGDLTEAQGTSEAKVLHRDKETTKPDIRVTETQELYPKKSTEKEKENVSTSEIYQMTSKKPLKIAEPVISTTETLSFSSETIIERKEQDDTTPEAHGSISSSARPLRVKENLEDGGLEMPYPSSESFSPSRTSQQQFNGSDTQIPFDDAETAVTLEQSSLFDLLYSSTEKSIDGTLKLEHGSDPIPTDVTKQKVRDSDAISLRSLIVTHLFYDDDDDDDGKDPRTTTQPNIVSTNNPDSVDSFTETQTERSSHEILASKTEDMPTRGSKTGKSRSRSHSVQTTFVPPSNPAGRKSMHLSKLSTESPGMTAEDQVAVVLIVLIVGAALVLVALLSFLGKTFMPKCPLHPRSSHEHGAVPYTEPNCKTAAVALKSVSPIHEDNRCTQV